MNRRKWLGIVLAMVLSLSSLFQGFGTPANAQGTGKEVDATITDFHIESPKGTTVTEINTNDSFHLAMDWKVKDQHAVLHEGDYFDIKLPDNMRFPPEFSKTDFDLTDSQGNVIAHAHVTPGTKNNAGGTIRVKFNKNIDNKYNVKGTIYLGALFERSKIKNNEKNTFEISVKGEKITKDIKVTKVGLPKDHVLAKWGERVNEGGHPVNKVKWYSTINHRKSDMKNCVISDEMTGNETFVKDSFVLKEVEYNEYGDVVREISTVDLNGKLNLSADNKSFTINLGNVGKKQYRLVYVTTYTPGTALKNKLNLKFDGENREFVYTFKDSTAGGTAGGELANKIKIIKVDSENEQTKLENAEFKITRISDGKEYIVKTDSKGEAITEKLVAGDYKIKEIKAPKGFKLNEDEIVVSVKDGQAVIKTIKDNPIKTKVSVDKKWIGPEASSVTMRLYADNVDTGQKVVLSKANGWKHTFDNLRQYKTDGTEIKYTIKEDVPENYVSKTEGTQQTGYTITNTNTEKIKIPVEKKWVGAKKDKITVKLVADGKETDKQITLNEASQWKGEFKDLPKYDDKDGHEIVYTVKEETIGGYLTTIAGSMKAGFTITNTITEKISISVTKAWIGKKGKSATVNLYANGKKIDSAVLSEANDWKHEFKNIEKYENGKKREFTIKEEPMANYDSTVTGDTDTGFTVTNKNTEKVKVPVEKTWVGPKQSKVTVRLLADGKEKENVELSEANNWKYEFKDLPKYNADGSEIKYTVKEDVPQNYESKTEGSQENGYTITNTNTEKVKIPVEKTWVGPKQSKATVRLFADGVEKENVELSEANNWKHEFKNLPKYRADGSLINYTVKEDAVVNYDTDIAGNANDGFKIKNSNNEKVKVPVEKTWVGPKQSKVTVRLYADGVEKQHVELSAANNWKHEFENLPKYNSDGSEIKYTVKEDAVENYDTDITGNANDGFKIKNSNNEKVKVPVEKTWVGPKQSKVTVRLLADGVEKQHVELSAANNWKHEFENLPKYNADGSEIKYTVKEDLVENYNTEITGNANDGFKIKNTNVEKIKIPVVKKWIGKELESVTVNLYADGKKIGEAKLSKSNGWKHAFENLPKYDEKTGEEIKYAIDENEILGYTAKITGDQEKGFEITNTQDTPKKPKTPKEPPKTGDDSQIILFSAISLGTVILMIMMLFVRRKQNK